MGECNYYFKARFPSAEHARLAASPLTELLRQGEAAYQFWQDARSRDFPPRQGVRLPTAEEFWTEFRTRFPLVIDYLDDLAGVQEWVNGLAGQLSSLVTPNVARRGDPVATLSQVGDVLHLKLSGIWHFTEMWRLEMYCVGRLKAVSVGSISEEDLDVIHEGQDSVFFDAIDVGAE